MMKRIFIACADERLRIAMLLLLEDQPAMVVVGITDRLPGLILQLQATQPDVLVLEWAITFQSLSGLLTDIHQLESPPKVIFLSSNPDDCKRVLAAGADYFIAKNAPPDELLPILNKIHYSTTTI